MKSTRKTLAPITTSAVCVGERLALQAFEIHARRCLGQYLMLVDRVSRTVREGKGPLSQEGESIFDRMQMDSQR